MTEKQAQALQFIKEYAAETGGVSPSYRQIADKLGLASLGNVYRLMNGLEERGHITRLPGQARSLTVVE